VSKSRSTRAHQVFCELLKEIRITKKLTQTDVAAALGLPQSYVSKYECGERRLDFVETSLVCEALGVGMKDFAVTFSAKVEATRRRKGG
jgi:transcriptional regulator with XRE-family HTH domain